MNTNTSEHLIMYFTAGLFLCGLAQTFVLLLQWRVFSKQLEVFGKQTVVLKKQLHVVQLDSEHFGDEYRKLAGFKDELEKWDEEE